jgi:hypothetical protein
LIIPLGFLKSSLGRESSSSLETLSSSLEIVSSSLVTYLGEEGALVFTFLGHETCVLREVGKK